MRVVMVVVSLIIQCLSGIASEPVRLQVYPQKFRTFYRTSDPRVPEALKRTPDPLPAGDARCVAVATDGALWLGTHAGAIRVDGSADARDQFQYFAGRRYLSDDDVRNIVADASGGAWIRTATGVSHLELRPMTLEQKAAYFEERLHSRHDRHGLVAPSLLRVPGNISTNQLNPNDNDGLWTAVYATAECFRYASLHSPDALANATKSIEALLFLERVTGRAGYPARSYIRRGEFREADGVWRWTPDQQYEWKSDTSSDEIVGHFFMFGVAWDLLPDSDLKQRLRAAAVRIADHLIAHGYNLTDPSGRPTTWGRWSRQYFESPGGKPDSPLNALELLSFLKTAAHVTAEAKYEAEYRKAAFALKYLDQTTRLGELTHELNYSDEELAMLSFYPLFRYEHDPQILAFYRRAADEWWHNIRREGNPLWTMIYLQSHPQPPVDLASAVWTLYRFPMDTIEWTVTNSHRKDVIPDGQRGRFGEPQSATLLPPDERPVMKWNGNPFRVDGGNGGRTEDDGASFLLPYWMGRYLGLLVEKSKEAMP